MSGGDLVRGVGRRWPVRSRARDAEFALEPLESRTLLALILWDGGGDGTTLTQGANWVGDIAPGAADDAVIDILANPTITHNAGVADFLSLTCAEVIGIGSTLTLGAASTISGEATFLAGSTIATAGDLTFSGLVDWDGGTLSGAGTVIIAPTATMSVGTGAPHTLACELRIEGIVNITSALGLTLGAPEPWIITGTVNINFAVTMSGLLAPGFIRNEGTINNNAGVTLGTGVPIQNVGTININAATTTWEGGGIMGGTINIAPGAALALSGDFTHQAGATYSGPGTLQLGGVQTFAAPVTVPNLVTLSGTLAGAGDVTFTNSLAWSAGAMSGTGATIIGAGATFAVSTPGTRTLARVLRNEGSGTLSAGTLDMQGGTLLNVFDLEITGPVTFTGGAGINLVRNEGAMTVSADWTVGSGVRFENTGTLTVTTGNVTLSGGGLMAAPVAIPGGSTLALAGDFTHQAGAAYSGAGTLQLGGVQTFSTAISIPNPVTLDGTLTGAGIVTFTNSFTWNAGTMSGPGTTIIDPAATMSLAGTGNNTLARELQVDGTLDITAPALVLAPPPPPQDVNIRINGVVNVVSPITISGDGKVTIQNQGVLNCGADVTVGAGVTVTNQGAINVDTATTTFQGGGMMQGTVTIHAGAVLVLPSDFQHQAGAAYSGAGMLQLGGTQTFNSNSAVTIACPINSSGTIAVDDGTLGLGGGGTISGPVTIAAGVIVSLTSDFTHQAGAAYSGAGTLQLGGVQTFAAPLTIANPTTLTGTLAGAGNVTFTNSLLWAGGTMAGTGVTIIAPGATMAVTTAASHTLSRTLRNEGTLTLASTLTGFTLSNGTLLNTGTATISMTGPFVPGGVSNLVRNEGAMTFTSPDADLASGVRFENTGTLTFNGAGALFMSGGGLMAGPVILGAGANLQLFSNFTHQAGAAYSGAGALSLNNAPDHVQTFEGAITVAVATTIVGMLTGAGDVTFAGASVWAIGEMTGTGATIVGPAGTMTISGGVGPLSRTLRVEGVLNVGQAGGLSMNGGTLLIAPGGAMNISQAYIFTSGGGTNLFRNEGTITSTAAWSTASGVPFENAGALNVNAGTATLNGTGVISGGVAIAPGATVNLASAFVHVAGASYTGSGSLNLQNLHIFAFAVTSTNIVTLNGTLTGGGEVTFTNSLTWTAGTMTGAGRTIIGPAATMTLSGAGGKTLARELRNGGTLNITTATVLAFNAGTLTNTGTMNITPAFTMTSAAGTNLVRKRGHDHLRGRLDGPERGSVRERRAPGDQRRQRRPRGRRADGRAGHGRRRINAGPQLQLQPRGRRSVLRGRFPQPEPRPGARPDVCECAHDPAGHDDRRWDADRPGRRDVHQLARVEHGHDVRNGRDHHHPVGHHDAGRRRHQDPLPRTPDRWNAQLLDPCPDAGRGRPGGHQRHGQHRRPDQRLRRRQLRDPEPGTDQLRHRRDPGFGRQHRDARHAQRQHRHDDAPGRRGHGGNREHRRRRRARSAQRLHAPDGRRVRRCGRAAVDQRADV